MPRTTRTRPAVPDSNYQIPHPQLVVESLPPLDRARYDLARFTHLWEQINLQARALIVDVADLEAAGGCPTDLAAELHRAIALIFPPEIRGFEEEGGVGEDDDDHDHESLSSIDHGEYHNHDRGESEGGPDIQEERLAKILRGMDVRQPLLMIRKYGPRVVSEALDKLHARPSGGVANPGAYLRAILRQYKPAPEPAAAGNRYTRGKYGHLVRT